MKNSPPSSAAAAAPSRAAEKPPVAVHPSMPTTKVALIRALKKVLATKSRMGSERPGPHLAFADMIRNARVDELGLIQSEMDTVLGLSKGQTAVWESNRNTPRVVAQEGIMHRIDLLVEAVRDMKGAPQPSKGRGGPRHKYKKRAVASKRASRHGPTDP